jgi:hypothetical protein
VSAGTLREQIRHLQSDVAYNLLCVAAREALEQDPPVASFRDGQAGMLVIVDGTVNHPPGAGFLAEAKVTEYSLKRIIGPEALSFRGRFRVG